jgi:predicted permease
VKFIRRCRRREEDLEQEIRAHLRMAERDRIDRGEDPERARFAVRREFGNVDMVKEAVRNIWGWIWLDRLIQDLRYGLRMIRRNPAFSAAVVITLALGIGANISVFRVLNAVDLRPLPVRNPEELVKVQGMQNGAPQPFSYPLYREIYSNQNAVEGIFASVAVWIYDVQINGRSLADRVDGRLATGNYFRMLGTRAHMGRMITESDDQPSAAPVAVISDRFWKKEFGASAEAIGRTVTINKLALTVIGVAPPDFFGETIGSIPDVWIPVSMAYQTDTWKVVLGMDLIEPVARLRPDVPREKAQERLSGICNQQFNQNMHASSGKDFRIELQPLGRGKSRLKEFLGPLHLLMAIAGFVILIACCNLASLFLARAAAQAHEVGVRIAIGASRIRLVHQLMTESLLLAGLGGVLGFTLGAWGAGGMISLATSGEGLRLSASSDWRVIAFAAFITIAAACILGLAPALSTSRRQLNTALQANRRSHTGRTEHRAAKVFIIAQLSISLVLIAGALLLVRSFWNIYYQDWGYRRDRILIMDFAFDPETLMIQFSPAFRETLQQRLSAIPGVLSAAFASEGPLGGMVWNRDVALPDRPPQASDHARFIQVSSRYFETMDIPIIAGRSITEKDIRASQPVAVISQAAARKLFGAANPVGSYFSVGKNFQAKSATQIVGVAHDMYFSDPREPFGALIFQPKQQALPSTPVWYIRTEGDPMVLVHAIRSAVHEVNPDMRVGNLLPWGGVILSKIRYERMMAWIAGGLGLLALVLACVGLYGVISFGVQRRTQEIGIHLALGATRSRVCSFLLREAFWLLAAGIVIGGISAFVLVRWTRSVLFGLTPHDPAMMITAVFVLCFVAISGAYLPARRASHLDPIEALRQE